MKMINKYFKKRVFNSKAIKAPHFLKNDLLNLLQPNIDKLKENLDATSKKYIDFCIYSLIHLPTNNGYNANIEAFKSKNFTYPQWLLDLYKSYQDKSKLYYFGHGLDIMPTKVKTYIENKIAFDLGSFDGGSALMLSKNYNFSHIHSFDISLINMEKIKANLKKQDSKKNITLHHLALGDKIKSFEFEDNGEVGTKLNFAPKNNKVIVNQSTLDIFMKDYPKDTIGFIKMDIEESEMDCLRGARESIIKDRPVLAVSIYHNLDQFFNAKVFLQSLNLNYKFMIVPCYLSRHTTIIETNLLAYPEELA